MSPDAQRSDPVAVGARRLWLFGIAAAGAGPLALWAADIEPPWPTPTATMAGIATLFCALAAIIARVVKARKITLRRVGVALLASGGVLCIVYLIFFSEAVVTATQNVNGTERARRWVIGTELHPEFRNVQASDDELLAMGSYRVENVWTKASVTRARIVLLSTYLAAFACIVAGLTLLARLKRPGSEG